MLKIGEFSKLSHLTVKALRFYEKEGILMPAAIDEWTGYRYYETSQLSKEEPNKIRFSFAIYAQILRKKASIGVSISAFFALSLSKIAKAKLQST